MLLCCTGSFSCDICKPFDSVNIEVKGSLQGTVVRLIDTMEDTPDGANADAVLNATAITIVATLKMFMGARCVTSTKYYVQFMRNIKSRGRYQISVSDYPVSYPVSSFSCLLCFLFEFLYVKQNIVNKIY